MSEGGVIVAVVMCWHRVKSRQPTTTPLPVLWNFVSCEVSSTFIVASPQVCNRSILRSTRQDPPFRRDSSTLHQMPVFSAADLYAAFPFLGTDRQIRLLELRPAKWDNPLEGQLSLQALDYGLPQYTALSYVWGSGNEREISVNNIPLAITENLYTALKYLRYEDRPRKLWVDVICIHQFNNEERKMQVAQMSAVYEKATTVISWLGEATNNSELVMQHLRFERFSHRKDLHELLHSFWELPYWTRVWIVQEIACAKKLIFKWGREQVEGDRVDAYRKAAKPSMSLAASRNSNSRAARESPFWKFHDCLNIAYTYKEGRNRSNVLALLRDAAPLKSTEEVDKVYGLLQLLPKEFRDSLPPDYGIDFPKLSGKVMEAYQRLYRNLNLLCEFQPLWYDGKFEGCSSWLVDLRQVWKDTGTVQNRSYKDKQGNPREPRAMIIGPSLHTRGAIMSKIDKVLGPLENTMKAFSHNFQCHRRLLQSETSFAEVRDLALTHLRARFPHETDLEGILLRMLAGKKGGIPGLDNWPYTSSEVWDQVAGIDENGQEALERFGPAFELLFVRLGHRCFFTTRDGYIGLGPPCLQAGDLVCAVYGCRMLLALREQPGDAGGAITYRRFWMAFVETVKGYIIMPQVDYPNLDRRDFVAEEGDVQKSKLWSRANRTRI
ncbi:heterokaryon incompatibility protein-domain-containing protein [Dactylonectria macrodidyma]|uniref:Heterokaryon incompatibility protein-domain-containing protein n=1 Tax=Dactylonectria macrodidyma TaxID=307937 RepID=A0A9P9E561_9HYPO|nr:heterokaryon incompatibility protein-domain-containing protein [Dactylonectria macrodidyma]